MKSDETLKLIPKCFFFEKIPDNIFCIFWGYKNNFKIFSQLSKKYKYFKNIFSVFEKIQMPKKYFLDFWKNIFEKIIFFRLRTEKIYFFIFSRVKWKNISEIFSRWDTFGPALMITDRKGVQSLNCLLTFASKDRFELKTMF